MLKSRIQLRCTVLTDQIGSDRLQVDMLENNLACLNKMSVEVTSLADSIIKRMPFSDHTH